MSQLFFSFSFARYTGILLFLRVLSLSYGLDILKRYLGPQGPIRWYLDLDVCVSRGVACRRPWNAPKPPLLQHHSSLTRPSFFASRGKYTMIHSFIQRPNLSDTSLTPPLSSPATIVHSLIVTCSFGSTARYVRHFTQRQFSCDNFECKSIRYVVHAVYNNLLPR